MTKRAATIWVCSWVIAGASLQVMNWHEPALTGWRAVGSCMFLIALLAPRSPHVSPSNHYSLQREWRWRLFAGSIAVLLLLLGVWVLYVRYYGPLLRMVNRAE